MTEENPNHTPYRLPDTDEALLAECDVQVFRSSGPGGQSVNTADSAVRLIHRPTCITVSCQRQRSQLQNKRECLRRLREKIEASQRVRTPRVATRPSATQRAKRLTTKRTQAVKKRLRQKPSSED